MPPSKRATGVLIALICIACSAPDATLLRSLQQTGASNYVIMTWKTFFVAFIQLGFAVLKDGPRRMIRNARSAWPWVLIGAGCLSVAWLATLANLTTSSASALCLFYIFPLWAVPLGFVFNREALHCRTIAAMTVALIGVVLVLIPNFVPSGPKPEQPTAHRHAGSLFGDLCGLISGLAFAGYLTCMRSASLHRPDAPLALCNALGTILVVFPSLMMVAIRGRPLLDVSASFLGLLAIDCGCIAAYNTGCSIAARYLPSAELGLVLTLDCVFAPFLVWLFHNEMPSVFVLAGGAVLLCSLITHEMLALRESTARTSSTHPAMPNTKTDGDKVTVLQSSSRSEQPVY